MPQGKISDKNTRIAVTISKSLKSDSEKVANDENRSLSNLINTLLSSYVYKDPKSYLGFSEIELLSHAFSSLLIDLWNKCDSTKDTELYEHLTDEVFAIHKYVREHHIPLPLEIDARF